MGKKQKTCKKQREPETPIAPLHDPGYSLVYFSEKETPSLLGKGQKNVSFSSRYSNSELSYIVAATINLSLHV